MSKIEKESLDLTYYNDTGYIGDPITSELEMLETDLQYIIDYGRQNFGRKISSMQQLNHLLKDCEYLLNFFNKTITKINNKEFVQNEDNATIIAEDLMWLYGVLERTSNRYNPKDAKVKEDDTFSFIHNRLTEYKNRVQEMLEFYFDLTPFTMENRKKEYPSRQKFYRVLQDESPNFTTQTVHAGFYNVATGKVVKKEIACIRYDNKEKG